MAGDGLCLVWCQLWPQAGDHSVVTRIRGGSTSVLRAESKCVQWDMWSDQRERAKQELVSCLLWALHNINTQLKKYVSSDRMIKSLINPQLQYIQMIISSQVSTAQMLNKLLNHIHKCFSDDCKISGWSCWVDYVNDGSKSFGRGNIRRTPESSRHQTWDCESPDHGDLGRNDAVSWFSLNISGRRLPWRSLALLLPSLAPPGQC